MKMIGLTTGFVLVFVLSLYCQERLGYHAVRLDQAGMILPWNNEAPSISYDEIVNKIWVFWDTMRVDHHGIPYYMNHQVWRPDFNDPRGIGGDQIQMALSSWRLLYPYNGNQRVKDNMRFMADYYLSHGLSPKGSLWPDLPYPYNTLLYSGTYDGDMVIGKNYTQPDKAGSLGFELVALYKMMSREAYPHTVDKQYLQAAIAIANTLAAHVVDGDENNSPLPFKVNAVTGETGALENITDGKVTVMRSSYTSNWSATLELFLELIRLQRGDVKVYQKSVDMILTWMKKYPMQTNKWGPFFEDVPGWSDTQINAMTWTRFIMNHRDLFPSWKSDVTKIIDWVYATLGNDQWKRFGVIVVNEQTAYRVPGNSHTARQAADELFFASLTGDNHMTVNAIRRLNWATYWVDNDGKNFYPTDDVWLTDGYGDYLRHFLRAMAANPSLAPAADHILSTTSVLQQVAYAGNFNRFNSPAFRNIDEKSIRVCYTTFDNTGVETLRVVRKPKTVLLNRQLLPEVNDLSKEGFQWKELPRGGVITIKREHGDEVFVLD